MKIMNDLFSLTVSLVFGCSLGAVFFGGLWWTVRKGALSKRPALWFLGSMLLRMSVTLSGFYFVSGGHWERVLACLLGFVSARLIVTRVTSLMRMVREPQAARAQGINHAP
jgi:F1F0 ATPase subunit 2